MDDREIVERLKKEAETHTPDISFSPHAALGGRRGEDVVALPSRKKWLYSALAAFFLLLVLLAVLLPITLPSARGNYATLVVSINPTAEFTVENGKVTKTRPLNRDAAVLLSGVDFSGETAEDACLGFARLAEKRHLVGAEGIRIHASGRNGAAVARSVENALADALFLVGELDEEALRSLFGDYDEDAMERFEEYVEESYSSKREEFLSRARALLETYRDDLMSLDFSNAAALDAFNRKYFALGEDFLAETDEDDDASEMRGELLEEYDEIVRLLEEDPEEAFEELFEGFFELVEEGFEEEDD